MSERKPAIFFGHGNPMNAIQPNAWTETWRDLPLLYVIALQRDDEPIAFPLEGVDGGSVSMLAVRVG